jgi:glycosyltransferase involved in cell wall biosynthesis
MNKHPFFSIVIATYNRADLIGITIRSILDQTVPDFELIIVDDGSKDNTADIIRQWMEKDGRIRYIYQENKERGAARNNGFRNATGDFVLFFDSDDEMLPHHLEALRKAIEKHPEHQLFATKYAYKNEKGIMPSQMMKYKEGSYDIWFVLKGNPIGTLFCISRHIEGLNLFPEDRNFAIVEDWICLVFNMKQRPLYLIDDVTIHVNDHDARSMSQNQLVITRRLKATEEIVRNVTLNPVETQTIWAYSYYFCGVHAYLDHERGRALAFARKAIGLLGMKKDFLSLYLKSIVGKQNIERLKRLKK